MTLRLGLMGWFSMSSQRAVAACGDGTEDPGEDCDDGNQVTEWSCGPYGGQVPQPSCFVCDLNCRNRGG